MEKEKSLIENYENKVNALLTKIDFLEAQLEVSKEFYFNN